MKSKNLKPYNSVIQVCDYCGKIDVSIGHEKECEPEYEQYRRETMDHYN